MRFRHLRQLIGIAVKGTASVRESDLPVRLDRNKGQINRDIGDILGSSPMTVKKHLERIFAKLGVETRTAAAGMVMRRIRQMHPQFEG